MPIRIERFEVGFLSANCYVVSDDSSPEAILIDPGGGFSRVSAYLERIGKTPIAAICTHGHFDHVLDARKWQKLGAKIYLGREDEGFMTGKTSLFDGHLDAFVPTSPDEWLVDGETLRLAGVELEVIGTPGHSPGGVCLRLGDRCVFTGDTIFRGSYGRTDFPGGNEAELRASALKILALPETLALRPGHGESTTVARERASNPIAFGMF